MRQAKKIFSVMLAAVMLLSVWSITAFAELGETKVSTEVVVKPAGQTSSGLNIYEVGVYVDSTHSLSTLQLNLSYDSSAFQLMRSNKVNDASIVNANMVIAKTDPELAMYDGDIYTAYEGGFMDYGANPKYGYAMFPNDGTQPSIAKISNTNLGATLVDAGYTGVYWAWMVDYTDNYLLLSGADERNTEAINGGENFTAHSPIGGRVKVVTFYLREKEDAQPGVYTIGFNEDQMARLTGTYTVHNDMDSIISSGVTNSKSIQKSMVTYTNAIVTVGEPAASTIVTEKGPQIRYTKTDDGAFANAYDVRTRATIAAADVTATFGTTDAAALETAITSVGFVYAPAGTAFDTAAAQAAAKAGSSSGGYTVAPVNYIQQEADGSLMFTCLVTGINTNAAGEGLQTYAYICVNGEYYFYDAATTVSYNELFTNNWASAAGAYGWDTSVPSLG